VKGLDVRKESRKKERRKRKGRKRKENRRKYGKKIKLENFRKIKNNL
jgi:hypothetical protein